MLECPYCFRVFRTSPEKLGARCPKCRMPLFEGAARRRRPEKEVGDCALHAGTPALTKCERCDRAMCGTCRTRWQDEAVCTTCVDESLALDEPSPQEGQRQHRMAWMSVGFAGAAWFVLLMTLWPLSTFHDPAGAHRTYLGGFFYFSSFVPALFALGQAAAAVRLRGETTTIALIGLIASGSQLGLMLGLLTLGIWHN